jgi:hypothetical protein
MDSRSSEFATFAYRTNADGSIDSICLDCFLTAGSAQWLPDLKEIEKDHDCKQSHVEKLLFDEWRFSSSIKRIRKSAIAA